MVTITVEPLAAKFSPAEAVQIRVVVKNTGSTPRGFVETWPERDIWLKVKDANSRTMPLTRHGLAYEDRDDLPATRRTIIVLEPGESREHVLQASRFYDMTVSGDYWITARMSILSDPKDIFSRPIPIASARVKVHVSDSAAGGGNGVE